MLLIAFEIFGNVMLSYATACALWFGLVLTFDALYVKSNENINKDAGLAVLALALIPLWPIARLADAVHYCIRKVRP